MTDALLEVLSIVATVVPDEAGEAVLSAVLLLALLEPLVRLDDAHDTVPFLGAFFDPTLVDLFFDLPTLDLDGAIDGDCRSTVLGRQLADFEIGQNTELLPGGDSLLGLCLWLSLQEFVHLHLVFGMLSRHGL